MSTKIDAYQSHTARPVASTATSAKPATATTATASSDGKPVSSVVASDSLRLTGDALQLHQFEKTLSAIPSTDRSRVDRLKQAVSDGTYTVDSKAVAGKLARLEFTLGQA